MSAIIQVSRVEKLSQEPLPTGDSCVLVIFGASGDLTKRKLIPGPFWASQALQLEELKNRIALLGTIQAQIVL